MDADFTRHDALVVMKAGPHARQSWGDIIERKLLEQADTDETWWGYGGTGLDPETQVRRLARQNSSIGVAMFPTNSVPTVDDDAATEYSVDSRSWQPIPKGIRVTGSTRALVIRSFAVGESTLDLRAWKVALGVGVGRLAVEHFYKPNGKRVRTDKACLERRRSDDPTSFPERVTAWGELVSPYAVYLR